MSTIANNLVGGDVSPKVRVRGLRAPQAVPARQCLHCGVPLTADAPNDQDFCCAGCSYVYRLIHEQGLDQYYKVRDPIVAPVGEAVFRDHDFDWLAVIQAEAELTQDQPVLELEIQGISCAGCVWLIERLFHQQPGSLQIEVDAQLGRLRLRGSRGQFDARAFARTLSSFNYLPGAPGDAAPVLESRLLARRIGLSAAFSMNVMLFTLPTYFGMEHTFAYARLFGLLSMAFATFGLLTGGTYFIKRALRACREGVMHIDLPIAVGILGSYAGSLYGRFTGREELVYFDFVAAFILLMLVGRWAQTVAVERNRHRLLNHHTRPRKVRVMGPAGSSERAVEELATGDLFVVKSGEVIPVESRLESEAATLGTAWINGEADPRNCGQGALVPSGAVNLGRTEIVLHATQTWRESLLAQLLQPARRNSFQHVFLERVIRGYLIGIFGIASCAGLGWWLATRDVAHTWSVVTAILVVSCPCAIGLAFPLTDELATVALRRRGVFVREADVWPRLARVRKIIFDKTGTLTLETPTLENPEAINALSGEARAVLFALVENNPHPISQSLYQFLLASGKTPSFVAARSEFRDVPGSGVSFVATGKTWSLGRPGWRGGATVSLVTNDRPGDLNDTEFTCDGAILAQFRFKDAVRPDAVKDLEQLRELGFAHYILSGDRAKKVNAMASTLGIPSANAVAEKTPGGKADWIKSMDERDTLMVGDGANDSLAFDAAFVRGTPIIHRGVLEGKSDFYYLGRGIDGLRALFTIAALRRQTQRWLLGFSILYNFTVVAIAVAGHMNPLIAAVLMPTSSLANLAIVTLGMRRANSV